MLLERSQSDASVKFYGGAYLEGEVILSTDLGEDRVHVAFKLLQIRFGGDSSLADGSDLARQIMLCPAYSCSVALLHRSDRKPCRRIWIHANEGDVASQKSILARME